MASTGIHRMVESGYFKKNILPDMENRWPIDADKVKAEIVKPHSRPMPAGGFARGIVEELRKHPLAISPVESWGIWDKPVVMCHAANGGVEYQEEQVKYFGSAMLDLNSPVSWGPYTVRADKAKLKWTFWRHCHNHVQIDSLLGDMYFSPQKTGGLNLEDVFSEGISIPRVAAQIDERLGTDSILAIPTLGWIQNLDWSALSRHVFFLEFFINDPPPDWHGIDPVDLARQLQEHAKDYGAKKIAFLCGIYDASANNPAAKKYSASQYLDILKRAGVKFGGIYLGDNNGSDYAQWA